MNTDQNKLIYNTYIQQIKTKHFENENLIQKLVKSKKEYETLVPKLETFRDKISIDVMVPISSSSNPLAFVEGTAVHTNELLVALGSKYLTKMSTKDTIDFCRRKSHEISQKKIQVEHEQKLLLERLCFLDIHKNSDAVEIFEQFDADEDKKWRQQHALSIKKMKAVEAEERKKINELSSADYFARLAQLEEKELEEECDT